MPENPAYALSVRLLVRELAIAQSVKPATHHPDFEGDPAKYDFDERTAPTPFHERLFNAAEKYRDSANQEDLPAHEILKKLLKSVGPQSNPEEARGSLEEVAVTLDAVRLVHEIVSDWDSLPDGKRTYIEAGVLEKLWDSAHSGIMHGGVGRATNGIGAAKNIFRENGGDLAAQVLTAQSISETYAR